MTLRPLEFSRDDVEVLARERCHSGFLKIDRLTLRHSLFLGGQSDVMEREVLVKPEAVGLLLYDPNRDEVVMVRQFRVGVLDQVDPPWLLELIAGMVGEGEDLEQVASRESQEEAGCVPARLIRICDYYNSPGASNEKVTLFCGGIDASTVGGVFGLPHEHEDIEVVVLSFAEAVQSMASGLINNAMAIIAVQWLQLHKAEVVKYFSQDA